MAARDLAVYIDGTQQFVDITRCRPGPHTRAIKPGEIARLKKSIMDTGYQVVHTPDSITPLNIQGVHTE
jgi:hypothetical protein